VNTQAFACRREFDVKQEHPSGANEQEMRERLDKLSQALDKKRSEAETGRRGDEAEAGSMGQTSKAMALGFRIISELAAGVIVGALLGWQLDEWTGMQPLFLIVFLMLGTAAGFWNMVKLGMGTKKPPVI
jgi:ATP synthase protein I